MNRPVSRRGYVGFTAFVGLLLLILWPHAANPFRDSLKWCGWQGTILHGQSKSQRGLSPSRLPIPPHPLLLVPQEGLEPSRFLPTGFEAVASTCSATEALVLP